MNLYHYIHSALLDAISEKYPEIILSETRVHYQVSPVNKTYICTAVPRVIMSTLRNDQDSNAIAHELISCINPDLTFINQDIFISDGFINFQVSSSYTRRILCAQPSYEFRLFSDTINEFDFLGKLKRLLDYADSFWPKINISLCDQYPLLNQTEIEIITLIAFTEFTNKEKTCSFIVNSLVWLLKKYYLEVPIFTEDFTISHQRIMLIKQACSTLYCQIKNAQPTQL